VKARPSAIFITLMVTACSGPGSPLLRTSVGDGEGPLVQGCQNVSSVARVEEYITNFYLSTWGSAFAEGTMEGFGEGIRDSAKIGNRFGQGVAGFMGLAGNPSEIVHSLAVPPSSYCRVYAANPSEVLRIVAGILPMLGNDIRISDETNGLFVTELIERQHGAERSGGNSFRTFKEGAARWRDSYEITVTGEAPNER
jgi:hypothetical protein